MMSTPTGSESRALVSLQSKDHVDLLNIIDELRSHGISRYVDLPQIIVCGDQSSGKSSVLEAISRIKFPTKDNLCTRFATELILRRSSDESVMVSIVPAPERSNGEKTKLEQFSKSEVDLDNFKDLIESAKNHMGLERDAKAFSNDVLRVEISGPGQPHLTLVDLPGLFQAGNKTQSEEDAALVKDLVLSYMKKSRSIILAVVSAKNDFANQIVTKYARELDPGGLRTLGLITKPDTLHAGSDSEKSFQELASNRDVHFRLGWHIIKNRDYDSRDCSDDERDRAEKEFFSRGTWASLPRSQVGIHTLTLRLSSVLKDQILSELPSLILDVQRGVNDCKEKLERLGASRSSSAEQRTYLLHISQQFSTLMKASVDGAYSNAYFGSATTKDGYEKRLRAFVQNTLMKFAESMALYGHSENIVDSLSENKVWGQEKVSNANKSSHENASSKCPDKVLRSDYLTKVQELMTKSRGRELPGTFNPLIIGDLFYEQSKPWQAFVFYTMNDVLEAVEVSIAKILAYITDPLTSEKILRELIDPALEDLKRKLKDEVSNVLEPHQRGHPITYNHYFTENIQKAKEAQFKNDIQAKLAKFFNEYTLEDSQRVECAYFDIEQLQNVIVRRTQPEMDLYACSEALECMQAYYKVAMKVLVDSFSALCIENCLLKNLPALFAPDTVISLDDISTAAIAGETSESAEERAFTQEKLDVLERGLKLLKQLNRHRTQLVVQPVEQQSISRAVRAPSSRSPEEVSKPSMSPEQSMELPPLQEPMTELELTVSNLQRESGPVRPRSNYIPPGVRGRNRKNHFNTGFAEE